jgi:hypothetical protein
MSETITEQSTVEESPKPRDPRAFNAYRHGLTGHVLVLEPHDELAYKQHCESIHKSFSPSGGIEIDLVQSIADDRWRMKRAAAIETNLYARGLNDPDDIVSHHDQVDAALATSRVWLERNKDLALLTLYESRIQRRIEKNIALLFQIQQRRQADLEKYLDELAILGETYDFPPEFRSQQFDFSQPQIARLLAHHRRLKEARTPRKTLHHAA